MALDKDRVMQKVQQLMRKCHWDKALDEMKSLHAEDDSDPMVSLRLGDLFLKAGKSSEAARSYYRTAGIFARDGYTAKAIATYKMILRIDPDYEDVERRIGELALEKAASSSTGRSQAAGGAPSLGAEPPTAKGPAGVIELSEAPATGEIIVQRAYSDTDDAGSWYGDMSPAPEPEAGGMEPPSTEKPAGEAEAEQPDTVEPAVPDPQPIPLFTEIPKDELRELLGRMRRRTYSEGDTVVREGEQGDSLFIIKNGGVRVVTSVKGVEVVLAELGERDFFGEVSFLTGRPRTADIVASGQTEILELARGELERLVERYPDIGGTLRMFHENRVSDTLTAFKAVSKEMLG